MPDVKNIGKPCALIAHARIDEGGQARVCPLLHTIYRHRPHPHASGAGRAAATARTGRAGGSVSGGVRGKTGLG